jgi:hypothetical protein
MATKKIWVKLEDKEGQREKSTRVEISENDVVDDLRKKVKAEFSNTLKDVDASDLDFEFSTVNFSDPGQKILDLFPDPNITTSKNLITVKYIKNIASQEKGPTGPQTQQVPIQEELKKPLPPIELHSDARFYSSVDGMSFYGPLKVGARHVTWKLNFNGKWMIAKTADIFNQQNLVD